VQSPQNTNVFYSFPANCSGSVWCRGPAHYGVGPSVTAIRESMLCLFPRSKSDMKGLWKRSERFAEGQYCEVRNWRLRMLQSGELEQARHAAAIRAETVADSPRASLHDQQACGTFVTMIGMIQLNTNLKSPRKTTSIASKIEQAVISVNQALRANDPKACGCQTEEDAVVDHDPHGNRPCRVRPDQRGKTANLITPSRRKQRR
jgi:hypothetical protein